MSRLPGECVSASDAAAAQSRKAQRLPCFADRFMEEGFKNSVKRPRQTRGVNHALDVPGWLGKMT